MSIEKYTLKKIDIIEYEGNEYFNMVIENNTLDKKYDILLSETDMLIKNEDKYIEFKSDKIFNVASVYFDLILSFITLDDKNVFYTIINNGYTLELNNKKTLYLFDIEELKLINNYIDNISSITIQNDSVTILFNDKKIFAVTTDGIHTDIFNKKNVIYNKILLTQVLIGLGYISLKIYKNAIMGENV